MSEKTHYHFQPRGQSPSGIRYIMARGVQFEYWASICDAEMTPIIEVFKYNDDYIFNINTETAIGKALKPLTKFCWGQMFDIYFDGKSCYEMTGYIDALEPDER